jgi:mycothiol synthase
VLDANAWIGDTPAGEAVRSLLDRIERFDGREALSEHKASRVEGEPSVLAVVGTSTTGLVVYAQAAWHHPPRPAGNGHWAAEIAVAPEARRPGIWASAVIELMNRVPRSAPRLVWSWDESMDRDLADMGCEEVRRLHLLARPLPIGQPAVFPDAVSLSGFTVGTDEERWLEANNEAFVDHPENGGLTRSELDQRIRLPWFRPEDVLMAWEGDDLVGSCWTKRPPGGVGEIYIIGVRPRHRGRGIGRALVLAGLDHLHAVGHATEAILYVEGANTAARWLYRDLGFDDRRVGRVYAVGTTITR